MIDIDRLRTYLDDATEAEPWLRSLYVANPTAAHANFARMATQGVTLDLLAQIGDQLRGRRPGAGRSRHGDQQPGAVHRRLAQSDGDGRAVRARSGGTAESAADLLHQPVFERPAGGRPRGVRPVADDRGPAGLARGAGRRNGWRGAGAQEPRRCLCRAAAFQTPRDDADRLRRHRSQSAGGDRRPAAFVSCRCDRRRGARLRPAALRRAVRPAAAQRRQPVADSSCWRWASWAAWS